MFAIFAPFEYAERERAARLFTESAARHSATWRTIDLDRLGLADPTGEPTVRTFPICPLGAVGFVRWGAAIAAQHFAQEVPRRASGDTSGLTVLNSLLFPHPDMIARNLVGWSWEDQVRLLDPTSVAEDEEAAAAASACLRFTELTNAASKLTAAYAASKLDRAQDVYEALGIPFPTDAYTEARADGSSRLRRLGAS